MDTKLLISFSVQFIVRRSFLSLCKVHTPCSNWYSILKMSRLYRPSKYSRMLELCQTHCFLNIYVEGGSISRFIFQSVTSSAPIKVKLGMRVWIAYWNCRGFMDLRNIRVCSSYYGKNIVFSSTHISWNEVNLSVTH